MMSVQKAPRGDRGVTPIELVRPSFYGMMVLYYCGLATYGATSFVFLSPSLVAAGGDHFALIWASLVAGLSIFAAVGVAVSRRLRNGWIEFASTISLFSLLIGYSAALLLRGLTVHGATGSIPLAWLPLILSVMPVWRIMVMAQDGTIVLRWVKHSRLAAQIQQHKAD